MEQQLVTILLPLLAVVAGRYLYEGIQIVGAFVNNKLSAQVHFITLTVIQFALVKFSQWIGIAIPTSLDGFTPALATSIATALIAMGWHAKSGSQT